MNKLEFTLKDRKGNEHKYEVALADPDQLLEVAFLLNSFAAEPIAEGLQALTRSTDTIVGLVQQYMGGEFNGMTSDAILAMAVQSGLLEQVLGSLNVGAVSAGIRAAIMVPGMIAKLQPLFNTVFRDGHCLGQRTRFNDAYRANYGEYFQALWKVIDHNGLVAFLDIASGNEAETPDSSTQNPSDSQNNMTLTGGGSDPG